MVYMIGLCLMFVSGLLAGEGGAYGLLSTLLAFFGGVAITYSVFNQS